MRNVRSIRVRHAEFLQDLDVASVEVRRVLTQNLVAYRLDTGRSTTFSFGAALRRSLDPERK
jgi:hypothetical protein